MRSIYAFAASLALLAALTAMAQTAGRSNTDWPNWRGPDHNGVSAETGWLQAWTEGKAKCLWEAPIGTGFSSLAVAGGRAYTMGNRDGQDTVYCFDAATGKRIWKYSYPSALGARNYEGGTHCTPTVDGQWVYAMSKWGHVFCFDAKKGTVRWKIDLQKDLKLGPPTWGFATSPRVLGDMLILNAGSAGLAVDKNSGKKIWASAAGKAGYATPVLYKADPAATVLIFSGRSLAAVRAKDGQVLSTFGWKTDHGVNAADPIVKDGRIFISSGYNKGCALLALESGRLKQLWANRKMRNHFNSCVLWNGHVYGFDETTLRCLGFADGSEKWHRRGLGKGSLMLADGKLILLSDRGRLVIASAKPDGFEELAGKQILSGKCWTVPVLSGGRIYARSAAGKLVCYGAK